MGKSTLINLMVPSASAQIGEVSRALNRGRHTTTTSTWYWLNDARDAALIDSPGFQEFGLQHLRPERLAALMPDIGAHASTCRFYNCTHLHEPGCAVREAVHAGAIDASRYRIFEQLNAELGARRIT
jgi:ribosome biogenesis GTPase